MSPIYSVVKRALDCIVSVVAIILLSPIFIILSVLLFFSQGRPVLFLQDRPGYQGKVFTLVKFRTMRNPDPTSHRNEDAVRLTKIGAFLRSTSLDELPSLFNVLAGQMSIVGPRPLLVSYLDLYSADQARRHNVRPGMTGLAQVSGRNQLTWDEKFDIDLKYVESVSAQLDFLIVLRTFGALFTRKGISHSGSATMPEFRGSNND